MTHFGEIQYRGSPHEFHENLCYESHALVRSINEIVCMFSTFFLLFFFFFWQGRAGE